MVLGIMVLLMPAGCAEDKPQDILSEKQMVDVMTELYMAEEKAGKIPVPYDSLKKILPSFSARAFEKSGISDTLFRKSLEYYMGQPEKLENIYTTLVDSLNLQAQRARTIQENAVPR